jgi:hypothetical protein
LRVLALERWRRVAVLSATDPAASQQIRQDFQRWSDDYQKSIHTRLERVHSSAGVWLSVLTTIVALLGSLVLLKGGSLVTEVTATGWLQALLVGLVSLVFLVAVLALLAGAVATWGGLWDFGGQAQSYSDPEWFPHITRVARWLARIPAEDRDHSMAGKPEWVTYRDRYRSNAERSRIYLHASRMLGGVAAILIGVVAIAAITVGTFAAAPTYVLVVYPGGVTCSTSDQYAKYPQGVTQVTPVDSCQLPGRKG